MNSSGSNDAVGMQPNPQTQPVNPAKPSGPGGAVMEELKWWSVRRRGNAQYEMLCAYFRARQVPPRLDWRPPLVTRPVLWAACVVVALGDQYGHWFSNGGAALKLRPVKERRATLAKVFIVPLLILTSVGPAIVAYRLGWSLSSAVAVGVLVATPLGVWLRTPINTLKQSRQFNHRIDLLASDLVRYRGAPKGVGLGLLNQVHARARNDGLVVGGVASSVELRDSLYLGAGRIKDCEHHESECVCLRTVLRRST